MKHAAIVAAFLLVWCFAVGCFWVVIRAAFRDPEALSVVSIKKLRDSVRANKANKSDKTSSRQHNK